MVLHFTDPPHKQYVPSASSEQHVSQAEVLLPVYPSRVIPSLRHARHSAGRVRRVRHVRRVRRTPSRPSLLLCSPSTVCKLTLMTRV